MKYELTNKAKQDIRNISKYTLINHGKKQEHDYIAMLYKQFDIITHMPKTGNQSYMSKKQIELGLQKMLAGQKKSQQKHNVFYIYNALDGIVKIVAIVHINRDIKRALQDRYVDIRAIPKEKEQSPKNKGKNKSRGR